MADQEQSSGYAASMLALFKERGVDPNKMVVKWSVFVEHVGMIAKEIAAAKNRALALEKRIADLEAGAMKYCGTWERQRKYSLGSTVTFRGALWHAHAESTGVTPGDNGGACWRLAVKRGRA